MKVEFQSYERTICEVDAVFDSRLPPPNMCFVSVGLMFLPAWNSQATQYPSCRLLICSGWNPY